MKKLLVFLCTILLFFGVAGVASALDNGGFETGDLTYWTATVPAGGSAQVVTSHDSYGPVEGTYFAQAGQPLIGEITSVFGTKPMSKYSIIQEHLLIHPGMNLESAIQTIGMGHGHTGTGQHLCRVIIPSFMVFLMH